MLYKKICTICNKSYETIYQSKNICSWLCKREKNRQRSLIRSIFNPRGKRIYKPCIVCGYKETTDIHHENGKEYVLCPNHHALITRGIKLFPEILRGKSAIDFVKHIS